MKKSTRVRLLAAATILAATGAVLVGPVTAASAAPPPLGCRITSGRLIYGGDPTICEGGQYVLNMQTDGNFVEYGNGRALWSTQTQGNPGAYISMQSDSNAAVYSKTGKVLWTTHTAESGTYSGTPFLSIGNDGNVAVTDKNGKIVWQNHAPGTDTLSGSNTLLRTGEYLHSGTARLTVQSDGNVVSTVAGKPVWSTRTNGHGPVTCVLQSDGNFVVYTVEQKALFSTKTSGAGTGNRLVLLPTGRVELLKGATVLWKTP